MKTFIEAYKCAMLTAVVVLLLVIVARVPREPLTWGQMRAQHLSPAEIRNRLPVVYVWDGSISVQNLDDPMRVEVEEVDSPLPVAIEK